MRKDGHEVPLVDHAHTMLDGNVFTGGFKKVPRRMQSP